MQYNAFFFNTHFTIDRINQQIPYEDLSAQVSEYYIKRDDHSGKVQVDSVTLATTEKASDESSIIIQSSYAQIGTEEMRITGNASFNTLPFEIVGLKRVVIAAGCTTFQSDTSFSSLALLQNVETIRIDAQPELINANALRALLSSYGEKPPVIEADDEKLAQKIFSTIVDTKPKFEKTAIIMCVTQKIKIDMPKYIMGVSNLVNIDETFFTDVKSIRHLVIEDNGPFNSLNKYNGLLSKMQNTLRNLRINMIYSRMEPVLGYIESAVKAIKFKMLDSITMEVLPDANTPPMKENTRARIAGIMESVESLSKISVVRGQKWEGFQTTEFAAMCPEKCHLVESDEMSTFEHD